MTSIIWNFVITILLVCLLFTKINEVEELTIELKHTKQSHEDCLWIRDGLFKTLDAIEEKAND